MQITARLIAAAAIVASMLAPSIGAASTNDKAGWTPFAAPSIRIGTKVIDAAAVLIPVRITPPGVSGWMQLDTAINVSTLYEKPLRRAAPAMATLPPSARISAGTFDADVTPQVNTELEGGAMEGRPLLGTVGIDAFRGRVLAIDFPRRRLAVATSRASLPADAQPRTAIPMQVTTVANNGANLIIGVRLGERVSANVAYDTGTSALALVLRNALWRDATGRTLDDRRNIALPVPSWGQTVPLIGAPARGDLSVGVALLHDPVIYTGGDAATEAQFSGAADGTLGNAAFIANYVVVLDFVSNVFGLREAPPPRRRKARP